MEIEIVYLATSGSRILLKMTTFQPIKFFCEKREGHSKRERMEIMDLHLKRVFAG